MILTAAFAILILFSFFGFIAFIYLGERGLTKRAFGSQPGFSPQEPRLRAFQAMGRYQPPFGF